MTDQTLSTLKRALHHAEAYLAGRKAMTDDEARAALIALAEGR